MNSRTRTPATRMTCPTATRMVENDTQAMLLATDPGPGAPVGPPRAPRSALTRDCTPPPVRSTIGRPSAASIRGPAAHRGPVHPRAWSYRVVA